MLIYGALPTPPPPPHSPPPTIGAQGGANPEVPAVLWVCLSSARLL